MLGVFVGSAALIIILSAFNGIENLVISMSNTLNPDLVILPAQGKTFNPDLDVLKPLKTDHRLASYSEYLKEKALLRYGNQQYIGEVKGVKPNYSQNKALKNIITNYSELYEYLEHYTTNKSMRLSSDEVKKELPIIVVNAAAIAPILNKEFLRGKGFDFTISSGSELVNGKIYPLIFGYLIINDYSNNEVKIMLWQ